MIRIWVPRREQTIRARRATARDDSVTIADRLSRIESILMGVQATLDIQFKRIAALQAEIDHLRAKRDDRGYQLFR